MKSEKAAERLERIALLLRELGDDGNVTYLGCSHFSGDACNANRNVLIRIELKDSPKHVTLSNGIAQIAHELEADGETYQGILPFGDSLEAKPQQRKRKRKHA